MPNNKLCCSIPWSNPAHDAIIDKVTRKAVALLREGIKQNFSSKSNDKRSACFCGVLCDVSEIEVRGYRITRLFVHIIAYHRHDVPKAILNKIAEFDIGEEEPTKEELLIPKEMNIIYA